jgi:hypothetical protein
MTLLFHYFLRFSCLSARSHLNYAQEMLLEKSSRALQSLAELDAKELQRHSENLALWQVRSCQAAYLVQEALIECP